MFTRVSQLYAGLLLWGLERGYDFGWGQLVEAHPS